MRGRFVRLLELGDHGHVHQGASEKAVPTQGPIHPEALQEQAHIPIIGVTGHLECDRSVLRASQQRIEPARVRKIEDRAQRIPRRRLGRKARDDCRRRRIPHDPVRERIPLPRRQTDHVLAFLEQVEPCHDLGVLAQSLDCGPCGVRDRLGDGDVLLPVRLVGVAHTEQQTNHVAFQDRNPEVSHHIGMPLRHTPPLRFGKVVVVDLRRAQSSAVRPDPRLADRVVTVVGGRAVAGGTGGPRAQFDRVLITVDVVDITDLAVGELDGEVDSAVEQVHLRAVQRPGQQLHAGPLQKNLLLCTQPFRHQEQPIFLLSEQDANCWPAGVRCETFHPELPVGVAIA